jgi:hypothetical protein
MAATLRAQWRGFLAIVYCFVFPYFWMAGGGEWSLDRLRAPTSAPVLNRTQNSAATVRPSAFEAVDGDRSSPERQSRT